jgi:hypothetical protein
MGLPDFSYGGTEQINLFNEEIAFSIGEVDSEKIDGSGHVRSAISHRFTSWNVGLIKH